MLLVSAGRNADPHQVFNSFQEASMQAWQDAHAQLLKDVASRFTDGRRFQVVSDLGVDVSPTPPPLGAGAGLGCAAAHRGTKDALKPTVGRGGYLQEMLTNKMMGGQRLAVPAWLAATRLTPTQRAGVEAAAPGVGGLAGGGIGHALGGAASSAGEHKKPDTDKKVKKANAMIAAPLVGGAVGGVGALLGGHDPVRGAAMGVGVGLGGAAAHRGARRLLQPGVGKKLDYLAQRVGAKVGGKAPPIEPIWSRAQGSLSPHAIEGIEGGLAGAGALGGGIVGNRVGNMLDNIKKAAALASKVIKRADDMNTPMADDAGGHGRSESRPAGSEGHQAGELLPAHDASDALMTVPIFGTLSR